ncbi:MAG: hypothetical protein PUC88_05185 [Clostridia bacterium]|nr:hypothetical protein [Clostridia bacterium]
MQCEIIFYVARKTGINHQIFNKKILSTELKVSRTMVATSPLDLADQLKTALNRSNLVFILGGLFREDETNIVDILSRSIEPLGDGEITCKRIENSKGSCDGYIIQSGKQMIIMLPDAPNELETMTGSVLMKYISDFYGLKYRKLKDSRKNTKFKHIEETEAFFTSISERSGVYEQEPPMVITTAAKVSRLSSKIMMFVLIGIGVVALGFIVIWILLNVIVPHLK